MSLLARPEWLPLLLLAPAGWLLFRQVERSRGRRFEESLGGRARALAAGASGGRRRLLLSLGLLFAAAATLHPVLGGGGPETKPRGADVVLCLDVSRSMLARDLPPDRLSRAREEIRLLAERAEGDRLGLVLFAGEARMAVPRTAHRGSFAALARLADPLAVARGGTDLGAALEEALRLLPGENAPGATVVLLTDGEDLEGRGRGTAERLRRRGVTVHCVGFGTALGGKIPVAGPGGETFLRDRQGEEVVTRMDPVSLSAVAAAAGGRFVDASAESRPLLGLYEEEILPRSRRLFEAEKRRTRRDRFQWPLAAAILLWVLDLRLSGRTLR